MRTANSTTVALAEPGSFRSTFSAAPVHFKDASGAWQRIDTSLAAGTDGRFRSRANAAVVELAPSTADAELARIKLDADHSVGYRLHNAAPATAAVAGNVATYTAALPDVTLELTSAWNGLKEDLVLTSKAAPSTYLFPLVLRGLTANLEDGEVVYRDGDGKERARTPRGWMQDSTPPRPAGAPANPPAGTPSWSEGVTYALVPHEGGTALQVTLDRAWLDDPARVYPVRVDPTTTFSANTDDTYVATNDTTRNDLYGDLNAGTETCCTNTVRYRSFIHFDTGWLRGRAKGISYARIATYLWGGWSCDSRATSMYRVAQAWSGTTMASYPGANVGEEVARLNTNPCPNQWVQWDQAGVLDMVHNWNVSQTWPDYGVMIKAYDENDNSQWRRFYSANQSGSSPHLVVDWWGTPNTPDTLSPASGATVTTSKMQARYTHSDDTTSGQLRFRLYNSADTYLQDQYSATICDGCSASWTPTIADGTYRWDVAGLDGANRWSAYTARRSFVLDRPPNTPVHVAPANGADHPAPPTLTARYSHPSSGDANGRITFNVYSSSTATTPTWSQQETGICNGCNGSVVVPASLADGQWWWDAQAFEASSTGSYSSSKSAKWSLRIDRSPPAPPTLSSSSHPDPATWYGSRAFQGSWSAPSDATGIDGYSVVVDQLPDTVPPGAAGQTATTHSTTVSGDGQWYLHVRAVDGVGNWSDAAHLGFKADATTPGAPSVVSSTHVDAGAWYADRDPSFDWSGGDTDSGLAGWSFVLDQVEATTPDDASEGTLPRAATPTCPTASIGSTSSGGTTRGRGGRRPTGQCASMRPRPCSRR